MHKFYFPKQNAALDSYDKNTRRQLCSKWLLTVDQKQQNVDVSAVWGCLSTIKIHPSDQKCLFWDALGIIFNTYLEKRKTINSEFFVKNCLTWHRCLQWLSYLNYTSNYCFHINQIWLSYSQTSKGYFRELNLVPLKKSSPKLRPRFWG